MVKEVSSTTYTITKPSELLSLLNDKANDGEALMKGNPIKPLVNESRAGCTDPNALTDLLVLDVDEDLPYTRAELVYTLGLHSTYVFQHSSKSTSPDSIRGHYFFLLDTPVSPSDIKETIKAWNFLHCKDQITLSSSKAGLHWPLDVSVNDNGKIIYIAPPIGKDLTYGHIILVKGETDLLTFRKTDRFFDTQLKINSLRNQEGLDPQRTDGKRIVINPDAMEITGFKEDGEFLRFNFNGGDSWGYYCKVGEELILNFKDEPSFRLKDVAPELHAKFVEPLPSGGEAITVDAQGNIVPQTEAAAGFRDRADDLYYQILYDQATLQLTAPITATPSKNKFNDFLVSHGAERQAVVNDGSVIFDPTGTIGYNPITRTANLWAPTMYQKEVGIISQPPIHIDMLIRHITVDEECYHYFMNWLAYIWQTRQKTGTAWLFHGTTGTGKGTLFAEILQPIFGHEYTHQCTEEHAVDQYNAHMQQCLILFIDEFDIKDDKQMSRAYNKLKNYITERTQTIRAMRSNQKQCASFTNVILATNVPVAVKLEDNDRRINIPPKQTKKLADLYKWRDKIKGELSDFCAYLRGYEVNAHKATHPLMNQARLDMIKAGRSSHEEFFIAFRNGDLAYFQDHIVANPPIHRMAEYCVFENIIKEWSERAGESLDVKLDDLLNVYNYVTAQPRSVALQKFGVICRHNDLETTRKVRNGAKKQYVSTTFIDPQNDPDYSAIPENIIPLR